MATLNIDQAAEYLHISTSRLAEKAAKGIVPAYKPFKSWLFFESELEQFVKDQKCHSTNKPALTSGSLISLSMGKESDAAAALRPSKLRRNTMTA